MVTDRDMKIMISLLVAGIMAASVPACAQRISMSTDLLGYACLGTLNADVSYSMSKRWSIGVGLRYNPFTFNSGDPQNQLQLRQRSLSLGARLWPWHTGSGWWFAGKIRGQEYNWGGLLSRETEEGIRFGAGIYSGYTHMLSRHFSLEFGLGLWGGYRSYRKYSCQKCGTTVDRGHGAFMLPDDISLSLVYVL